MNEDKNDLDFDKSDNNEMPSSDKQKNSKLILLICIFVFVILVVGVLVMCITGLALNNNEDNSEKSSNSLSNSNIKYKPEKVTYDVTKYNATDVPAITNLTFTYNGTTLKYPFTLKDMENIGIKFGDYIKEKNCPKGKFIGNLEGYTTNSEPKIGLVVTNISSEDLNAMDCVVTSIWTSNTNVAINSIQPGTSTYNDILRLFGRDKEERKNTLENENIRIQNEGMVDDQLDYYAQFEGPQKNTFDVTLTILMEREYDPDCLIDSVYSVDYSMW